MASLRRSPNSPYWIAVVTLADGSRTNRSTRTTDKEEAKRIAGHYQDLINKGKQGTLTTDHAKKVMNDLLERCGVDPINKETVEEYLRRWAKGRVNPSTAERYGSTVNLFLTHLGSKSRGLIGAVTHKDILGFIESRENERCAPKTISVDAKILNTAFNLARKLQIRADNPVERALALSPIVVDSSERDVFTPEQIAKLVNVAKGDWLTLILLGYYTGARIGDCASMQWDNVNLTKGVIDYVPQKTRKANKTPKRVIVPMHPELEKHLQDLASTDKPENYLSPALAAKGSGGKSGLSEGFKRLIVAGGIDPKTSKGKGTRQFSKLSFHSLRHGFNSILANEGIDQEIRMALTGHNTKAINSDYTHFDLPKLKSAIAKLPSYKK